MLARASKKIRDHRDTARYSDRLCDCGGAHLNEMLQPAIQVLLIQQRVRYELAPQIREQSWFYRDRTLGKFKLIIDLFKSFCSDRFSGEGHGKRSAPLELR
jgi:hypothetical protein